MKTVPELQKEITDIQAIIKTIQQVCPHLAWTFEMYSWRIGALNPVRLCVCCKGVIPGITDEEARKVWEDFYKDTNDVLT